ncbi:MULTISPECIES: flagella synthesis protein FlgN [Rahnella]|jgi:flagella synthesis protein FlgN|uniref:flagella synthesis protein FlgN n=1 Tax=Rahnella TaxID=34037 RepID=UPI000DD42B63|nr:MULTISPECIES: flagellar export chaperone FlgN [Rahnella]MDH2898523.1 flagellar export chaperone FlgN [Rahnella variigena]RYJ12383.1 flagellar biosynthesis protein FlgN [Rahnella variigena]TCQ87474.1 flagella synthesis protein FlgN [Rahnella sp. JUb53]
MKNFIKTMTTLVETLQALDQVINHEQTILCSGRVNGAALQHITEQKSSLLATVDYLDKQRRQHDERLKQNAPYLDPQGQRQPEITAMWEEVVQLTTKLSQINRHNGMLLGKQIAYNTEALAILNASQTQKFYGPNGQETVSGQTVRKISV